MRLHQKAGQLEPKAPFDFGKSLEFIYGFSPTSGEQEVAGEAFTKATSVGGQAIAFEVKNAGSVGEPTVEYRLVSEQQITLDAAKAVVGQITAMLSLHDDLTPFYEIGLADPDFAPVIRRLYGLHHVRFPSLFESACWSVLGQRIPIAVARNMKQALINRYGSSLEIEGRTFRAFPEWEAMADVSTEELTLVIKNGRKAEYLSAVIRAFSSVDESFLRTGPYNEAEAWLRNIKGIGEWSAAFILLRGLGRMDHMLLNLNPIKTAASRVYCQGRQITQDILDQIGEHYGSQIGYWAYYLRTAE